MQTNQDQHSTSSDVEVRMFFERTTDREIFVERIRVSKEAPQNEVCEKVLHAWGQNPKIDEIDFLLAQSVEGSVIVNRPDLLNFVDSRPAQYL